MPENCLLTETGRVSYTGSEPETGDRMTDLNKWIADHRQEDAIRNAATFRRIATRLAATGQPDSHGNTARTFEACAKRCDRIAQGS